MMEYSNVSYVHIVVPSQIQSWAVQNCCDNLTQFQDPKSLYRQILWRNFVLTLRGKHFSYFFYRFSLVASLKNWRMPSSAKRLKPHRKDPRYFLQTFKKRNYTASQSLYMIPHLYTVQCTVYSNIAGTVLYIGLPS